MIEWKLSLEVKLASITGSYDGWANEEELNDVTYSPDTAEDSISSLETFYVLFINFNLYKVLVI